MTHVLWRGRTFDARTRDMLVEVDRLVGPLVPIRPTQGSYAHGILSAGTHAGGGAVDLSVSLLPEAVILKIVRTMRTVGFAAWYRRSPEWSGGRHIHGIAVDCTDLNPVAARQVTELRHGGDGLVGDRPDRHRAMGIPVHTWEDYKAHRDGAPRIIPLNPAVKPGVHHSQVKDIQRVLNLAGYGRGLAVDGFYGPMTQAAVAHFHTVNPRFKGYGLRRDVKLGPSGWVFLQKKVGRS